MSGKIELLGMYRMFVYRCCYYYIDQSFAYVRYGCLKCLVCCYSGCYGIVVVVFGYGGQPFTFVQTVGDIDVVACIGRLDVSYDTAEGSICRYLAVACAVVDIYRFAGFGRIDVSYDASGSEI